MELGERHEASRDEVDMKAYEIRRPDTAFSLSPNKRKRPREHDKAHLDFIRGLGCLICGKHGVHAAHIRMAGEQYGKRSTGAGEKPSDKWTVPLCPEHHTDGPEAQHKGSEEAFWERHKINPFVVALALWGCSGDDEAAELVLREARR